jgi:hypothetical protein
VGNRRPARRHLGVGEVLVPERLRTQHPVAAVDPEVVAREGAVVDGVEVAGPDARLAHRVEDDRRQQALGVVLEARSDEILGKRPDGKIDDQPQETEQNHQTDPEPDPQAQLQRVHQPLSRKT